jgi:hypothetical protein
MIMTMLDTFKSLSGHIYLDGAPEQSGTSAKRAATQDIGV